VIGYARGMRHLLFVAALSLATVGGCSRAEPSGQPAGAATDEDHLPQMTVDEVEHAVAANQVVAVDCNPPSTRKRMGVVPGAILVTDDASFAPSELPADKTAKLVFYCANRG
jgi:hypothetical protein